MNHADYDDPKKIRDWFSGVQDRRRSVDSIRRQIAEKCLGLREFPEGGDMFDPDSRQSGTSKFVEIYDTTFRSSAQMLAGYLMGSLTPTYGNWAGIAPEGWDVDPRDVRALQHIETVRSVMRMNFSRAEYRFPSMQAECDLDVAAFGDSALWVEEVTGKQAYFLHRDLREIFLETDEAGEIVAVFRLFTMRQWQAANAWGEVPQSEIARQKHNRNANIKILHCVYRDPHPFAGQTPLRKTWGERYICFDSAKRLPGKDRGYHECPLIYTSWAKERGTPYGHGQGWIVVPTAKMLNRMWRTFLSAAEKASDPPWLVMGTDIIRQRRMAAGGLTVVDADPRDGQPIVPLMGNADHRITDAIIRAKQQEIRDAFFAHILQIFQQPGMTATQVQQIAVQAQQLMIPMIATMEQTGMEKLIERVYKINQRQGFLPKAPDSIRGRLLKVDYQSPIAEIQRATDAQRLMQAAQAAAVFADAGMQDVLTSFDPEGVAEVLRTGSGAPMRAYRTSDEIAAIQSEKAKQLEQQAMMETLGQGAQAAKNIGQAFTPPAKAA